MIILPSDLFLAYLNEIREFFFYHHTFNVLCNTHIGLSASKPVIPQPQVPTEWV